jgi:hypothetical protein
MDSLGGTAPSADAANTGQHSTEKNPPAQQNLAQRLDTAASTPSANIAAYAAAQTQRGAARASSAADDEEDIGMQEQEAAPADIIITGPTPSLRSFDDNRKFIVYSYPAGAIKEKRTAGGENTTTINVNIKLTEEGDLDLQGKTLSRAVSADDGIATQIGQMLGQTFAYATDLPIEQMLIGNHKNVTTTTTADNEMLKDLVRNGKRAGNGISLNCKITEEGGNRVHPSDYIKQPGNYRATFGDIEADFKITQTPMNGFTKKDPMEVVSRLAYIGYNGKLENKVKRDQVLEQSLIELEERYECDCECDGLRCACDDLRCDCECDGLCCVCDGWSCDCECDGLRLCDDSRCDCECGGLRCDCECDGLSCACDGLRCDCECDSLRCACKCECERCKRESVANARTRPYPPLHSTKPTHSPTPMQPTPHSKPPRCTRSIQKDSEGAYVSVSITGQYLSLWVNMKVPGAPHQITDATKNDLKTTARQAFNDWKLTKVFTLKDYVLEQGASAIAQATNVNVGLPLELDDYQRLYNIVNQDGDGFALKLWSTDGNVQEVKEFCDKYTATYTTRRMLNPTTVIIYHCADKHNPIDQEAVYNQLVDQLKAIDTIDAAPMAQTERRNFKKKINASRKAADNAAKKQRTKEEATSELQNTMAKQIKNSPAAMAAIRSTNEEKYKTAKTQVELDDAKAMAAQMQREIANTAIEKRKESDSDDET